MSRGVTGIRQAEAQDLKVVETAQQVQLGAEIRDADGNVYTYFQAGAGAIANGQLVVAEAVVANHTNQNFTSAGAIGDRSVTVTIGATAVTADQYREGYLVVNAGTGAGYQYKIKGHTAALSSATTLVIYLEEPLVEAVVAGGTSKYSLVKNPAKSVVHSTTLSKAIGVAIVDVPAASFGWALRKGLTPVLAQGAVTKGLPVIQSTTTAGAVVVGAAATDAVLGVANEALVTTEYRQVTFNIEK